MDADLLWSTRQTAARILRFLPCLGGLDVSFTPSLGVDIVESNHWKAHGSTESYGDTHPPERVNYMRRERRCQYAPPFGRTVAETKGANATERWQLARDYLRQWSADDATEESK